MTRLSQTLLSPSRSPLIWTLVMLGFGGCTPAPNQATTAKTETAEATADEMRKTSQCEDLLKSLMGQMASPQVILNFDLNQTISLLNQWARNCRENSSDPTPEILAQWTQLVGEKTAELMRSDVYSKRDAEHLQTCVWMGIVSHHVTTGLTDDLERVRALFDYVVRNISLVAEHPESTPFSLKGVLISGQGTVEDRIWMFAELLRQLKIDVVIISPAVEKSNEVASQGTLLGVLIKGETYLFDPELGIAFPAGEEKITPGKDYAVATLSQVLAKPELLGRLSLPNRPYPTHAEGLTQGTYSIYGHSSWWSPRISELIVHFQGEVQAEVYDGLTDLPERRGSLTRIKEYADKSLAGIPMKVWGYAEQQLDSRGNLNSLQQQVVTRLTELYKLPLVVTVEGGDEKETFDDPTGARKGTQTPKEIKLVESRDYYRARGEQILGDLGQSVRTMMNNQRHSRVFKEIDDPRWTQDARNLQTQAMHVRVMNDATYWIGICKLEQKSADSVRIAADKFAQYLREYPEGSWSNSVHLLLALSAAANPSDSSALEHLKAIPALDPHFSAASWWLRELGGSPEEETKGDGSKETSAEKGTDSGATSTTETPTSETTPPEPAKSDSTPPADEKPASAPSESTSPPPAEEPKSEKPSDEQPKGEAPPAGSGKPE